MKFFCDKTELVTDVLTEHRKIFWIFLLLALIWHLLWFWVLPQWPNETVIHRVELQKFAPNQLDQIRQQWKAKEKALLLQKNPNAPKSKEASKDARYFSDRNTIVEKETRAQSTDVLPKAGSQTGTDSKTQPQVAPQPQKQVQPKTKTRAFKLGNLGVPMHIGATPDQVAQNETPQENQNFHPAQRQRGADQALLEKNLPVGAENMLNTQESVYYSFYARIYESIAPLWQSYIREIPYQQRVAKGEYTTVADVVFDLQGNIVAVNIMRSSGVRGFDDAVQRAWKKLERFPNPPKSLIGPDGLGHTGWTFAIAVGDGFNVDYLPPSKDY